MNLPRTIEPKIQDKILTLLPDNPYQALALMAQLSANIVLSTETSIDHFTQQTKNAYYAYSEQKQ